MKAIRLMVFQDEGGRRRSRALLICESASGDAVIWEEGNPRLDGDRSMCIYLGRGDLILSVQAVDL